MTGSPPHAGPAAWILTPPGAATLEIWGLTPAERLRRSLLRAQAGPIRELGSEQAIESSGPTLLARGESTIHNVPALDDVETMAHLLRVLGARLRFRKGTMTIDTSDYDFHEAPYQLVSAMRASIYVLGPLLASLGRARVSFPGGCAWGPRPIDLHLKGLAGSSPAIVLACALQATGGTSVIVLPDKETAAYFRNDLLNFLGNNGNAVYPASSGGKPPSTTTMMKPSRSTK